MNQDLKNEILAICAENIVYELDNGFEVRNNPLSIKLNIESNKCIGGDYNRYRLMITKSDFVLYKKDVYTSTERDTNASDLQDIANAMRAKVQKQKQSKINVARDEYNTIANTICTIRGLFGPKIK